MSVEKAREKVKELHKLLLELKWAGTKGRYTWHVTVAFLETLVELLSELLGVNGKKKSD